MAEDAEVTQRDMAIAFGIPIFVLFVKSIAIIIYVRCISFRRKILDQKKDRMDFNHTVLEELKSQRVVKARK